MDLATSNKLRWDKMSISAANGPKFKAIADKLMSPASLARYKTVEKITKVPYWFIAVVHQREASGSFNTFLGNGQPLNRKTTIVPKGRGPFSTWEEGAVDALVNCPPYAARNKDWTVGPALAMLEKYNGLGYSYKNLPSPYVWAGTNQYIKGKYIADGVYDANHVDTQLGCAGLLKFMGIFKDVTTPIIATTVVGSGIFYYAWDFIQAHPYSMGFATLALALAVYSTVHSLTNKKNITNV